VRSDHPRPHAAGAERVAAAQTHSAQEPGAHPILTARDATEEDKARNFEAGADDYLTKSFAFAELVMRGKALLRRGPVARSSVLRVADLELDRLTQQVRRGGRRIELTPAIAAAVAGGFVLVRRALLPVERIAHKAAEISQHNFSERLPVVHSGDEIERLSVARNHVLSSKPVSTAFRYIHCNIS
jgi:DNA-binding response OmpR family regulator